MRCSGCGHASTTEGVFRSVSVEVPEQPAEPAAEDEAEPVAVALPALLAKLLEEEVLDDDNRYLCPGCGQRVCASRSTSFPGPAPGVLAVHLKRFRFDPIAKKRRKLAVPVAVPLLLQQQGQAYELAGAVLHSGTAMGGHYRAYACTPSGVWLHADDSTVTALTPEEVQALDLSQSYLLLYRTPEEVQKLQAAAAVPATEEVLADNERFAALLALAERCADLVALTVRTSSTSSTTTEVVLRRQTALSAARDAVMDQLQLPRRCGTAAQLVRTQAGRPVETYRNRDHLSLQELGLCMPGAGAGVLGAAGMAQAELLLDEEGALPDMSPSDMRLLLRAWPWSTSEGEAEAEAEGWKEVLVAGQAAATLSDLRTAASTLSSTEGVLAMVLYEPSLPVALLTDLLPLTSQGVRPGMRVVYGSTSSGVGEELCAQLLIQRNRLTIFHNLPLGGAVGMPVAYDQQLVCSREQSLASLRALIQGMDMDCFHFRQVDGPQHKDESRSLQALGLTDGSVLHLAAGKGCGEGEHLLRFEVEAEAEQGGAPNGYALLGELAVSEKATVLAVRKALYEAWPAMAAALPQGCATSTPLSPHWLRLRDLKGGKPSAPLRDDRVLSRCLLGLADGRRVLVQPLGAEERIGAEDVMLSLRIASYDTKALSAALDLCLPRTSSAEQLSAAVAAAAGLAEGDQAEGVELAKGFSTGPPLSLKTALKLKWGDLLADPAASLAAMGLRDGSLIVARGKADWARAQARVKAKREEMALMPVGAGAAAVKGARGGSSSKKQQQMAMSATEPSLSLRPSLSPPKSPVRDAEAAAGGEGESEEVLPEPSAV